MSYRDPYANHSNQPFTDDEFNPYTSHYQAHPSYDHSGTGYAAYDSSPAPSSAPQRNDTMRSMSGDHREKAVPPLPMEKVKDSDQVSGFEKGEFSARPEGDFKRGDNPWTQGGRASCIGRFCCCTLSVAIFLIISILLTLALWVTPPAVTIQNVGPATTGNQIQLQSDGVSVNLAVNISVRNPNYFAISFSQIKAEIFYPNNNINTPIGGGTSKDINFPSHQTTNFTFPFSLDYKISSDPNFQILNDLTDKCGSSSSSLTINYKITPSIRILFVPISPVVSNSFTFTCPLTSSDLDSLRKLAGILGGGSS